MRKSGLKKKGENNNRHRLAPLKFNMPGLSGTMAATESGLRQVTSSRKSLFLCFQRYMVYRQERMKRTSEHKDLIHHQVLFRYNCK